MNCLDTWFRLGWQITLWIQYMLYYVLTNILVSVGVRPAAQRFSGKRNV